MLVISDGSSVDPVGAVGAVDGVVGAAVGVVAVLVEVVVGKLEHKAGDGGCAPA